ncbi:hypothetical protein SFRURICE_005408 [Spodoptera frugiperda]|nr:hypothetical protein SFRURICE_005408 [Spodoptera frugiperda]
MRFKINSCVKVLIYFIISILQCEAFDTTENPVITLEIGKDIININTYYVEQNKSLQIIFKNSYAGHVRCYNINKNYGTTFIEKEFPNNDKDKSVIVSINGDSLNFTKTGLNVQHDGETFFSFIEHQNNIELVCANIDEECKVSLEYFNQNGEKIVKIPPKGKTSILFQTRLTSKQDKFYIDCICHTNNKYLEYRYRTYFYKQELHYNPDKQDNTLIVTVNGLLERYVRRTGSYFDYPIFKYVDGEMIIVTCEAKRPYSSIPLQFYFDGEQVNFDEVIKGKKIDDKIVATINSSTIFLNKRILLCGFNSISEKEEYARMSFESDVAAGTVRVFGLARSNILYQYRSGDVWTTVYQYSKNFDILPIPSACKNQPALDTGHRACHVVGPPCQYNTWEPRHWISRAVQLHGMHNAQNLMPVDFYMKSLVYTEGIGRVESSKIDYRESDIMKYAVENFTKTLTENLDKKIIKCIAYEDYNNYKIWNVAEVQLQLKDGSNDTDTPNNLIIIFACISGLVLTITVVGIVYWRKRIQRPKTTSNTEVSTSQPFYGNKMLQNDPNRGIYVLPENNDPKYEKVSQAPCNGVKEDNEMTPIPESIYDSCYSENSIIKPNNDVPKSPDCSDPDYHHYEEVNYLQCKPKPSEPQQRSSKIYNVAYDHVRKCRSGK